MPEQLRISAAFEKLKADSQMAFMPFIAAGDPNVSTTVVILREFGRRGVDLIEVGFPYSDPIADGPVIQASYTRALEGGFRVEDLFAAIDALPTEELPPLVAMVSYAIVWRIGSEQFVRRLSEVGFSGLIVPDLPGDEAGEFFTLAQSHKLDLVQLIAPTTPPERVERILRSASGFVYCISVSGTTGVRDQLPAALTDQLNWLRTKTDLPLAVGFGISGPDQVDSLRGRADGVIVGSAIVRRVEPLSHGDRSIDDVVNSIGEFCTEMLTSVHQLDS